jgi:predicted lipoprotein with Yx(FWY)xxD motif
MSPSRRRRWILGTFAVPLAALAACGGEAEDATGRAGVPDADVAAQTAATPPAPAQARKAATRRGKKLKLVSSQFGRILGDGSGQAVYVFDAENSATPECYGACAKAWPPVLTKGRPVAGKGVRGRRLGTTRRSGGKRQVTMNGRPLYYYKDDAPGRVLCHDVEEFGGLWLVVRGDGAPVP